jgi:ATP-binding cassette, subfamily G (WHITE), eye pigment precursor transporter
MVTFGLEKPIFMREIHGKLYSLFSYYVAKNLVEVPLMFVSPLIQQVIVYWAVGYQHNYIRFWMMYLVLVVMCFSATGLGFLIGATSDSVETSSAMATAFIMPILAFSGLVVNNSTLPVWFRWI